MGLDGVSRQYRQIAGIGDPEPEVENTPTPEPVVEPEPVVGPEPEEEE